MYDSYWKIDEDWVEKIWRSNDELKIPKTKMEYRDRPLPKVKKVIFNNPATVIMWRDGSKTVVKCQPGDVYDPEKGFVMAYLKKLLGNDNTFNKEIAKWVKED